MARLRMPRRLGALAGALTVAGALVAVPQPAVATGPADHVVFWNNVLLKTYRQVGGAPGPMSRSGAIMHVAIYDAANSVRCAEREVSCLGQPYAIKVAGGGHFDTAIDYAAYTTLRALYPALDFKSDLIAAQAGIPNSPERAAGESIGVRVGNAILALRAGDGSGDTTPYVPQNVPGAWRPTGSGPAATPNWGRVRPFTMSTADQFRPGPPAGHSTYAALLPSADYTAQFDEVKRLGAADSTERTADQTEAAWFWANDLDGTYKPPGQLFAHTQIVTGRQRLPVDSKAKLFAQLAMAMADAAILAWDTKYETAIDLWRPETAIQLAETDGNPATVADPSWQPLSARRDGTRFSPNFPAWIGGHAAFAYTWAEVMRQWFGTDAIAFTATTEDPHAVGVTRAFPNFTAAADENADSRIWLGVHYRFDGDHASKAAETMAENAVDARIGANHSDTELLYLRRTDVGQRSDCEDIGKQLLRERRWSRYTCQWLLPYRAFELYVS